MEPPAVALLGRDWEALEARLPQPWKGVLRAHRRRDPEPFAQVQREAQGAVIAVYRPETTLLLALSIPYPVEPLGPQEAEAPKIPLPNYPLSRPQTLPRLTLDPAPPPKELPVHPQWFAAQTQALAYSTCPDPGPQAASVFDPGREAEARLKRLIFLHAAPLGPHEAGLRRAKRRFAERLERHRRRLLSLPPHQGPYHLIPMRTGLLLIGQGGNAVPVLLGGLDDFLALIHRNVPPEWGAILALLPFDAQGRPQEAPREWARKAAERNGLSRDRLARWIAKARALAKAGGRGGALVVGKRITGFVASPVVWRKS